MPGELGLQGDCGEESGVFARGPSFEGEERRTEGKTDKGLSEVRYAEEIRRSKPEDI
jgi:hypothetical protein